MSGDDYADVRSLRAIAERWKGVPCYDDGIPDPSIEDELRVVANAMAAHIARQSPRTPPASDPTNPEEPPK